MAEPIHSMWAASAFRCAVMAGSLAAISPGPDQDREPLEHPQDQRGPRHDEGDADEETEDQQAQMSLRGGGDGDDVVEAHHHVGDGNHLHGPPQVVDGLDMRLPVVLLLRVDELDGDPEQGDGAEDLQIGQGHHRRHYGGEEDAEPNSESGAENDAPQALARRQVAAGEGDDDGIVAGQQRIDPDDLEDREPEFRLFHRHYAGSPSLPGRKFMCRLRPPLRKRPCSRHGAPVRVADVRSWRGEFKAGKGLAPRRRTRPGGVASAASPEATAGRRAAFFPFVPAFRRRVRTRTLPVAPARSQPNAPGKTVFQRMVKSDARAPYDNSWMRKGRPPFGHSVTVDCILAGTSPTYSGLKRRNRVTRASVFSICDNAPPMQARLPAANGR
jgi:hypothetical protein